MEPTDAEATAGLRERLAALETAATHVVDVFGKYGHGSDVETAIYALEALLFPNQDGGV